MVLDINSLNNAVISYYNLDENTGTVAGDSKGSNDGTINGATWTTGKIGSALSFDGVDDYVSLSLNAQTLNLQPPLTFSAWVKKSAGEEIVVLSLGEYYRSVTVYGCLTAHVYPDGSLGFLRGDGSSGASTSRFSVNSDNSLVNDDEWVHIAFVLNNDNANVDSTDFYVNGQLYQGGKTITGSGNGSISYTKSYANIGAVETDQGVDRFSPCEIDEPVLFNRALNQDEVDYLYASGSPTSEQQYVFGGDSVVTGVVRLAGSPVSGAVVRCFNTTQDTYVGLSVTDGDGVYSFDVGDQDVYHLTVEYFDESTDEKYLSPSKPFINSGGSS